MTISSDSTSLFLQETMDSAFSQIRAMNIAQSEMNKAVKTCLEQGCRLAAGEWLEKSVKTGKELEALWSVYYACEEAHKNIAR
jgi:hypothetical protein